MGSRFRANGGDGNFGSGQEAFRVAGSDCVNDESVGDAGDEVADVLVAGERRHGAAIRLVAGFGGWVSAFVFVDVGEFFVVCALPGAVAAIDGLVLRRIGVCVNDSIVRRNGELIGKVDETGTKGLGTRE